MLPFQKRSSPGRGLMSDAGPRVGGDTTCVICCAGLDTVCVGLLSGPDSCRHSQFCYDCVIRWAAISTTCPLCKAAFNTVHQIAAVWPRSRVCIDGRRCVIGVAGTAGLATCRPGGD